MIIRELRTDDYEIVHGFIVNEMGHDEVLFNVMSASLDSMRADDSYLLYVAEHNNHVVGFVSAVKLFGCVDSHYIEITCLVVSQRHQKEGIGKLLLDTIETAGKNSRIGSFSLTSGLQRKEAHAFYENNGYEKGGYAFYKGLIVLPEAIQVRLQNEIDSISE